MGWGYNHFIIMGYTQKQIGFHGIIYPNKPGVKIGGKEKVEKESMVAEFVGISAPSGMIQKNKRIQ